MAVRFLSGIDIGSSTFFVDDDNNRIGIGTGSPLYKLHVAGDAYVSTSLTIGSTTNIASAAWLQFNGANVLLGEGTNTYLQANGAGSIIFRNNAPSELMRITSAGNVGIGTTAPSGKVDIAYDMYTGAGAGVLQAGAYGNINFKGASSQGTTTTQQGITWQVDSYAGSTNYGVQAQIAVGNNGNVGTFMGFFTSNNYGVPPVERIRIQHNGNVGIGTTSPGAKLDVVGTSSTLALSYGNTVPNNPLHTNYYGGYTGIGMDSATAGVRIVGDTNALVMDAGYYTSNVIQHANWNSLLRVMTNGNVGIGTTAPGAQLDITKTFNARAGAQLNPTGGASVAIDYQTSSNIQGRLRSRDWDGAAWKNFTIEANNILLSPAGNVGIGTTSPAHLLDVSGTARILNGIYFNNAGGSFLWETGANALRFGTNNTERMRIDASGNVGIGTTSPTAKLHVQGTSYFFDQSIFIDKVGIGTTAPSYKLDVKGVSATLSDGNQIFSVGNTTGGTQLAFGSLENSYNWIRSYESGAGGRDFVLGTNAEVMRLTAAGNVGIGTTSPSYKLDVSGTARITGQVTLSNYTNGGLSVDSTGAVRVEPSYQNISLGESYASNLREYYFRNGYTVSPTDTGYKYAELIQQNLLNQASLVLIPQAVKTGLLAVNKPTGTNLTFTRSTGATRVGPDGLIEKVRTNLFTYSEDFSNAAWSKTDSTFSVDTLTAGAGTTFKGTFQNQVTQGLQNVYFDVAYVSHQWLQIGFGTGAADVGYANFDIQNKVVGTSGGSFNGQIQDFGTYVRISLSINAVDKTSVFLIFVDSGTVSRAEATSSTGAFKLFRSQLQVGDVPTDYIATTTAAVSVGPVANVPRLDYLGSSCGKLQLEPQRTNLVLFSEQFDNAAWTKYGSTITANATTSPDGYVNADKLVEDTNTGGHQLNASTISVSDATPNTISIFAKKGGANWLRIEEGYQGVGCYFDLENGVVGTKTVNATSATITEMSDGWYRCIVTGSSYTLARLDIYLAAADGSSSYTGDGTSGVYIYGASLEEGAYATSYIPTLGAAVTRGADACSKTGIGSLFGANAGTIYFETIYNPATNTGGGERFVYAQEDTSAGYIRLWQDVVGGNQQFRMLIGDGGSQVVNASVNVSAVVSTTEPSVIKWATAYENDRFITYINGVQRMIDTSGTAPTITEINFNNTFQTIMPLAQALVFPTALSNSDLAALTA